MTKFLTALVLAVLSQQTLATTVTGREFLDVGTLDTQKTSPDDHFSTNFKTSGKSKAYSGADDNAATYAYGNNDALGTPLDTYLALSLSSAPNVADVNLTLLFVGSDRHTGTVRLFGGSGGTSFASEYSLTPHDAGLPEVFTGYTGFNSVSGNKAVSGEDTTLGIFALTINLADAFPGFTGTFNGVSLQIYGSEYGGYDSALSLAGTTAAVVPVPAAVWLFGSGLIGLVGVARRRK